MKSTSCPIERKFVILLLNIRLFDVSWYQQRVKTTKINCRKRQPSCALTFTQTFIHIRKQYKSNYVLPWTFVYEYFKKCRPKRNSHLVCSVGRICLFIWTILLRCDCKYVFLSVCGYLLTDCEVEQNNIHGLFPSPLLYNLLKLMHAVYLCNILAPGRWYCSVMLQSFFI